MSIKKQVRRKTQTQPYLLSGDVLPGLKPFACQEITDRYGSRVILHPSDDPTSIYFHYRGELQGLFSLRTVVALYLVLQFPIPRPRATWPSAVSASAPGHQGRALFAAARSF